MTPSHPVGPAKGVHVIPSADLDRTGGDDPSAGSSWARIVPNALAPPWMPNRCAPAVVLTSRQSVPLADCQSPPDISSTACQPAATGQTPEARAFVLPDPKPGDRFQLRPSDEIHASERMDALTSRHASAVNRCSAPTRTTARPFVAPAEMSASGTSSSPAGPQPGQLRTWAASGVASQVRPSAECNASGSRKLPLSPKAT